MGEDKQVGIAAIVSPGATTNVRDRGVANGGVEGGGALELKLTDRTTDPVILESHEWMLFFPLCWYGLLLSLAMPSQNTEYHSTAGWIYRNCIWMEFDKWVET